MRTAFLHSRLPITGNQPRHNKAITNTPRFPGHRIALTGSGSRHSDAPTLNRPLHQRVAAALQRNGNATRRGKPHQVR